MGLTGAWQTACLVVLATGILAIMAEGPCSQRIVLEEGHTVQLDVIQSTSERQTCVIEFITKAEWRVVLTFSYKPSFGNISVTDDCASSPYYLLIGNDFTAIGQELLTSYKFCRETSEEEIVSRDSHLWLVLRDSPHHHPRQQHQLLTLNASALPQASCRGDEMECSPVQCVSHGAVCDGHRDCNNGLDEYCYDFNTVKKSLPKTAGHQHQERQSLPPEGSMCFLCRDGTCILPSLPRYDYKWGVGLWYLCDGIPHCPDGWDEQAYMCYLSRHFPQLTQSHLFECEAFGLPSKVRRQVQMWSLARCDSRRDCRLEEEEGEDRCGSLLGVAHREAGRELYLNPLALSLVIVFAVFIVISAIFVLRQFDGAQGSRSSRDSMPEVGILSDTSTELQSCLAIKSAIVVDRTIFPSMTNHHFERLRETAV